MTYPFAALPENLAAFTETLRRLYGFRIGPGELHDAARALGVVDLGSERAVRNALRPILGGTQDDVRVFDAAFTQFFFPDLAALRREETIATRQEPAPDGAGGHGDAEDARRTPSSTVEADDASALGGGPMTPSGSAGDRSQDAALVATSSYSPLEVETADAPELPRIDQGWRDAARMFVRRLQFGLSRRWSPGRRGRRFDFRRTLRAGLQTGGEMLSPRWLRHPRRAPRIVLLVDGSRSMSAYARTTLTMAVALATATMRLEVFTFSTGLRRATNDVRRAAAGERRRLDPRNHAWAGGTTIGACLRDFLNRFGERMVGRDTVVMIASDGLDVGVPDLLRDAMRELHRRSGAVVWLNPLLETEGYEPTALGMSAARPFITTFTSMTDHAGLARMSRLVRLRA